MRQTARMFLCNYKNQIDESWENSNEGYLLLRNISKLLWNYYEPKNKWQPAEGMEKFW